MATLIDRMDDLRELSNLIKSRNDKITEHILNAYKALDSLSLDYLDQLDSRVRDAVADAFLAVACAREWALIQDRKVLELRTGVARGIYVVAPDAILQEETVRK